MDSFADNIIHLIHNPELLATMQKNVIAKSSEYSIERIGKQWMDLLIEL